MTSTLDRQTERFLDAFSRLARAYQFRDRSEICYRGVSVSQCYTLEILDREGALAMGNLASHMYLDISTMTRTVEQLIDGGLVTRRESPDDRRIVLVEISKEGRKAYRKIRKGLLAEYRGVLESVPAASRTSVVKAVELLLEAFKQRRAEEVRPKRASGRAR